MKKQREVNEQLANAIKDFLIKNEIAGDTRIYFNNICYDFNVNGCVQILRDIVGSTYFDYANDDTVSISTEGSFYDVLNDASRNMYLARLQEEFDKLLEGFGYYYELGNAWNLSLYKIN